MNISLKRRLESEVTDKNIEVSEGQLVAIVGRIGRCTRLRPVYAGEFKSYGPSTIKDTSPRIGKKATLILSQSYELLPVENFRGLALSLVMPASQRFPINYIGDVIVGKPDILEFLQTKNGYEAHVEWVRKLQDHLSYMGEFQI